MKTIEIQYIPSDYEVSRFWFTGGHLSGIADWHNWFEEEPEFIDTYDPHYEAELANNNYEGQI